MITYKKPFDLTKPLRKNQFIGCVHKEYWQNIADLLYSDLQENRLIVVLAPAPDPQHSGHMIRAVESRNPSWYSDLYQTYGMNRTSIEHSLERLSINKDNSSHWDTYFRSDVIPEYLVYGGVINGQILDPNTEFIENLVKDYDPKEKSIFLPRGRNTPTKFHPKNSYSDQPISLKTGTDDIDTPF